ncbi:MAG TPA: hypothetical protein VMV95_00585 [Bacillota bacterium]|nr:hypothetical protein [Bacillota bacterium]
MNKKTLINVAYWGMILVVIATCIFLVIYLQSSGKECVADPLRFYTKKMGTECFCVNNLFG